MFLNQMKKSFTNSFSRFSCDNKKGLFRNNHHLILMLPLLFVPDRAVNLLYRRMGSKSKLSKVHLPNSQVFTTSFNSFLQSLHFQFSPRSLFTAFHSFLRYFIPSETFSLFLTDCIKPHI